MSRTSRLVLRPVLSVLCLFVFSATSAWAQDDPQIEPYIPPPVDAEAYVINASEAEIWESPDGLTLMSLLVNPQSVDVANAAMSVITAQPGAVVPLHTHDHSAEIIFIQSGGGELTLGGETVVLSPGEAIYIPPGFVHGYQNTTDTPMIAVQVYVGPGPEERFRTWTPLTPAIEEPAGDE